MRRLVFLPALMLAASLAHGRAATAIPAPSLHDRASVEQMLFSTGYSGVASMRLSNARWVGRGAVHGVVVDFVVDARTGRIVSQVPAP